MSLGFGVFQIQGIAQCFEGYIVGAFQLGDGFAKFHGALVDQGFQAGLIRAIFHPQAVSLPCAPHDGEQLLALKWLEEVIVSSIADRRQRHGDIVHGGDHHHGQVRMLQFYDFQQADAV